MAPVMKLTKLFTFAASALLSTTVLAADLPALSPAAKVTQTIGLTEVTVAYSSPAVRGRNVFGTIVPMDQVWRAGANRATKISFDKEVTFGTSTVPAGTYSLFMIPSKANWTVIINKDTSGDGAFGYKKEDDVARVEVKPESISNRERLAYGFANFTNDAGTLTMEWEKVRVSIPFKVSTEAQVAKALAEMQNDTWRPFNQAARYQLEQKKDFDAGLKFANLSLAQKEEWFNVWTKAQLLAAKGNYKEAYPLAQKAQQLGEKNPEGFFFSDEVKNALKDWKAKS